MNKAAAQMKEADAAIAAQKAELDKLSQIITEADQVPSTPKFIVVTFSSSMCHNICHVGTDCEQKQLLTDCDVVHAPQHNFSWCASYRLVEYPRSTSPPQTHERP